MTLDATTASCHKAVTGNQADLTRANEMTKTHNEQLLHADFWASKWLGDYNERVEAGKNDLRAADMYRKAQYWLDRLNRLNGDA